LRPRYAMAMKSISGETHAAQSAVPAAQAIQLSDLVEHGDGAIVSRTLTKGSAGTLTLFAFDAGQELSEHSAPFEAWAHVIDGVGVFTIGGQAVRVEAGQLVLMPANVPHAVRAEQQFKMLLAMLRHS
jgi:quercetin dioxygenase-like cupin family protein